MIYRKAGTQKIKADHESEILLHQAPKKAFEKLEESPPVKHLQTGYIALLAEKESAYLIVAGRGIK